jgi:hypothetical protein
MRRQEYWSEQEDTQLQELGEGLAIHNLVIVINPGGRGRGRGSEKKQVSLI